MDKPRLMKPQLFESKIVGSDFDSDKPNNNNCLRIVCCDLEKGRALYDWWKIDKDIFIAFHLSHPERIQSAVARKYTYSVLRIIFTLTVGHSPHQFNPALGIVSQLTCSSFWLLFPFLHKTHFERSAVCSSSYWYDWLMQKFYE